MASHPGRHRHLGLLSAIREAARAYLNCLVTYMGIDLGKARWMEKSA